MIASVVINKFRDRSEKSNLTDMLQFLIFNAKNAIKGSVQVSFLKFHQLVLGEVVKNAWKLLGSVDFSTCGVPG